MTKDEPKTPMADIIPTPIGVAPHLSLDNPRKISFVLEGDVQNAANNLGVQGRECDQIIYKFYQICWQKSV